MDAPELRDALEGHSQVLRARGAEVSAVDVEPPATAAEVDDVERQLGLALPPSFRLALCSLARSVSWSWSMSDEFAPPFDHISSGELSWSLSSLPELREAWRGWVEECFSDPTNWYDEIWYDKLAFASIGNGDQLAVDLRQGRAGAVVYLSHDDGEGHGYVMADSLVDLVDRWVPLACPGAEDWQWLPFVPWDEGPIEPASAMGLAWIEHLGLRAGVARPPPVAPSDAHVDALFEVHRREPESNAGLRAGLRALRCCSAERAHDVIAMLGSESGRIQETSAAILGKLRYEPAARALADRGRAGSPNGRYAALLALARLEGAEAASLRAALRQELDAGWASMLDWKPPRRPSAR